MANRASVQKLTNESVSGITGRLDNHESGLNTNAHGISNIAGLTALLSAIDTDLENLFDNKQDKPATSFTGALEIVSDVDFINSTTTKYTLNFENGILVSVI